MHPPHYSIPNTHGSATPAPHAQVLARVLARLSMQIARQTAATMVVQRIIRGRSGRRSAARREAAACEIGRHLRGRRCRIETRTCREVQALSSSVTATDRSAADRKSTSGADDVSRSTGTESSAGILGVISPPTRPHASSAAARAMSASEAPRTEAHCPTKGQAKPSAKAPAFFWMFFFAKR